VWVGQEPYLGTGVPCAVATVGARASKAKRKQLQAFNLDSFFDKSKVVRANSIGNNLLKRGGQPCPTVVALYSAHARKVNFRKADPYKFATKVLLAHSCSGSTDRMKTVVC
jgi:hypothetical protein